ncbi:MAG TPA: radical SAM protein [Planctomycetaceae bacterium]|jgi:7-carboxy-7-deazaguanine synthase|nr:radical SAM protein [Blastopirellula sp.]HAY79339.1 radical SAM protein [Planctomycetaceae bacterium]|tara:strand:+ start:86 stop:772 length:687 start_codon:yes stop_codon:yes gene_type:complete
MKIAEIYESVQGEGFLTGTDSIFVRTSGCNLRCRFCDTPFTSWAPVGDELTIDQILAQIAPFAARHVVITGGEPLLHSDLVPLCSELAALDKHITIETAGTLSLDLKCDLMSISPKLSNSTPSMQLAESWREKHESNRFAPEVIRSLTNGYPYQFKFVVESPQDCLEIEEYLASFPNIDRQRVLLMPEGTDVDSLNATKQWLQPYCEQHNLHFCPRMQITWFGYERAT